MLVNLLFFVRTKHLLKVNSQSSSAEANFFLEGQTEVKVKVQF